MKKEAKYLPVSLPFFFLIILFLVYCVSLQVFQQIIGWSMWFSDYIFLERSWDKDEKTLEVFILFCFALESLDSTLCFWNMFLFFTYCRQVLNGLRTFLWHSGWLFSLKELVSLRRSLKLLKNTPLSEAYHLLEMSWFLVQRWVSLCLFRLLLAWTYIAMPNQGFVSAVSHIRSFVPAIYDCTLTVRNNQPTPTLLRMFSGQSSEVTTDSYVSFVFFT